MADDVDPEALAGQLAAFEVEQFLVAAASTLASLGFAKLDAGDRDQARKAIDALASLLPQVEGELRGDLDRALASLQVAYASASTG